ncbi:MAG: NADH-quinone oxidoreductase subunit G [Ottowia sp.]|nr:NADH-quinone oxidoreductase subunit G [Ottowia sp.]
MVELEINGQKVTVPEGSLVMDAARATGTFIPHFCYHRKLSIAANCRMCLVEVEKAPKPLPACATPVTAGMKVYTHSEKAVQAQQSVMEFLLINHPLDCPICDQGGECQLQDLAVGYGKSTSRYQEEKRVVFHKSVGPLIGMEEMSRCIHCTRCVRFGQEIAGVMELGMLGRGEHAEITTFIGQTVDSELSGNMIDLCPVGALTSKPFRYSARTWELTRHRSIAPHDSLGSHIIVQTKQGQVRRVLPLENEAINECWLSDKDRFSYEGLKSPERLASPMIKQGGVWTEVDWSVALEYVANGLSMMKKEHGAHAIAALASPHSTLEELYLLQKLMRGLGTNNIDFRLRQSDFSAGRVGIPWLGMPIAAVSKLRSALLIGSTLRKDHPLLSARLRAATKVGCQVSVVHAADDDLLMPVFGRLIAPPSAWAAQLMELVVAIAQAKQIDSPVTDVIPSHAAQDIAQSLLADAVLPTQKAIFLGVLVVSHPQFTQLHALAQWIALHTGATLGFLGEAANTVGAYLAQMTPQAQGGNAASLLTQARRAYVLLHTEPEYDSADPRAARAVLEAADSVIVLSPFKSATALEYADVLLPIAPFTETAGTFVNCEGRAQSFTGVAQPFGQTRPAWKVLRVLGNMLKLTGFDYEHAEAIRDEVLVNDWMAHLSNRIETINPFTSSPAINVSQQSTALSASMSPPQIKENAVLDARPSKVTDNFSVGTSFERLADVPIYHADPLVRRAAPLRLTADGKRAARAHLPTALFASLGLKEGDLVRVTQDTHHVTLPATLDKNLCAQVVRVATATPVALELGPMFGTLTVTRA